MNILLVYPKPDKYKNPRFGFSYDMLILATILSKHHCVYIKDFSCENYMESDFIDFIHRENIDISFIECDSYALKRSQNTIHAARIIDVLNQYVTTIAYGNYCYITKRKFCNAMHTITDNDINNFIDYINQFEPLNQIEYVNGYDEIPYINRSLLFTIPYYKENEQNTLLQTAKGCENSCIFCQRKSWQSSYIAHSDDYVLGEIQSIKDNGFKKVWITDENFTFNLSRAKRLLKKIIQTNLHKGIRFFISSWANIDEEFLKLAKECNIKIISFGIESGNRKILQFYRKNIDIDSVPNIIQYANSIGIFTVGNFIIGAPIETIETIEETFDLIRKCGFDQVNIKNLDYMLGSSLYEHLPEEFKTEDHVFACVEKGLNSFSLAEIKHRKDTFLAEYYASHRALIAEKIRLYGTPF